MLTAKGSLDYLQRLREYEAEKPYMARFPVDRIPGAKQTNLSFETYEDISFSDLRGRENQPSLDVWGLEFSVFESEYSRVDFEDFSAIKEGYFKEVEEFLQKKTGATWVQVYDCDLRRRDAAFPRVQFLAAKSQPVRAVHIDHSRGDGKKISQAVIDERRELRKGRLQMITVWRPLFGPILDWPLALCDYRSVDKARDIAAVDLIYPHTIREGANFYFNPAHEWYFLSDQQSNEAWMIKMFDSLDGVSDFCPHASFPWQDVSDEARYRESIEVRAVVFHGELV